MCGNEATIRIERVGNGYTVDAYTPGEKDKPGSHKRSVATSPEHVMRAVGSHLKQKVGKKKGKRGSEVRARTSGMKKTARKKA